MMNNRASGLRWLKEQRAWEERLDALRESAGTLVPHKDPAAEPIRLPTRETRRKAA